MKVRIKERVKVREDEGFGGICYVPHRDDFFAANREVFRAIKRVGKEFRSVSLDWEETYASLARLGICETLDPIVDEEAYSGSSFLGVFPEIPTVDKPLVVNCFSTAHCPLKCMYCHADDLMQSYREDESNQNSEETNRDIEIIISTISQVSALVAVITGGDPLTSPERTIQLIEGLSGQKALVLDTSGVGDLERILPTLVEHQVHVRVSLDALGVDNNIWRPVNPKYVSDGSTSLSGAMRTISACLNAGLNVTVQTVVHSMNDRGGHFRDFRDGLVGLGVKHWVLHITVKGGLARKKQREVEKRGKRSGGVLPKPEIRRELWKLMEETKSSGIGIDIRCTDTDSTPNSVLLVNSRGDLFTEGYAHDGKVLLYRAGEGRPDRVRALFSHIDKFGHARRYLNWNPWYQEGVSLENICYDVPIPEAGSIEFEAEGLVEKEAKFHVRDVELLKNLLQQNGFERTPTVMQRDEYFDTEEQTLATLDYVVRVRKEGSKIRFAFKGPRDYSIGGEYSRLELEFTAENEEELHKELAKKDLEITWFFEKRRTTFVKVGSDVKVEIDEIPEAGFFVEIEGSLSDIEEMKSKLSEALGTQETKNYKDIFVSYKESKGYQPYEVKGAEFE